jgi:hypothetical protein
MTHERHLECQNGAREGKNGSREKVAKKHALKEQGRKRKRTGRMDARARGECARERSGDQEKETQHFRTTASTNEAE